jgi:hypothetical protein
MTDRVTWVDLETDLIAPGYCLPCPAIATTFSKRDGARLWLTHQLPELFDRLLSDDTTAIGGHNIGAFDLPVIAEHLPWLRPKLWRKLEVGQIVDTLVCERIVQINRGMRGELGLGACARKYGVPFATDKDSEETKAIRLSFGQFIGATEIPPAHARYALDDATVLPTLFERQWQSGLVSWNDQAMLTRQLFWQSLCSARGFRTDLDHVRRLDQMLTERLNDLESIARDCGFLRVSKKGEVSRNMKAIHDAIAAEYEASGLVVPRTDPSTRHPLGQVKADRLTLEDVPGERPGGQRLQALSEWAQLLSVRNKDIPKFYEAAMQPVHTSFGIADTTRATSRDPNCQNWGKLKGVRECLTAREGYALVVSDFKMLEIVAIAQLCVERLGLRTLADKVNAGVDIHAEIGADILGCAVEEVVARRAAGDPIASEARDAGKPANFGLNGGMQSAETFQLYARKSYGQRLSIEQCERIMSAWRSRAVDQQAYLRATKQTRNELGLYDIQLPRTESIYRRGLRFTEAANNPFQRLGFAVADRAGWLIIKAQYCPSNEADMSGSHMISFVHDEFDSESPLAKVDEHARLQTELMNRASREICGDVFAGADTKVLTHISKDAKARVVGGRFEVTPVHMPASIGGRK